MWLAANLRLTAHLPEAGCDWRPNLRLTANLRLDTAKRDEGDGRQRHSNALTFRVTLDDVKIALWMWLQRLQKFRACNQPGVVNRIDESLAPSSEGASAFT